MPTELLFALLILAALGGGLAGYEFADFRHKRNRKKLEAAVDSLEADVALFHAAEAADPQRAWIDMGKRSILNQIDSALRTIRTTLDPDR